MPIDSEHIERHRVYLVRELRRLADRVERGEVVKFKIRWEGKDRWSWVDEDATDWFVRSGNRTDTKVPKDESWVRRLPEGT